MTSLSQPDRSIVALAGRRIDSTSARETRFPFQRVPAVRTAIAERFRLLRTIGLVSSAACGADLLALDVADVEGIPSRIVLPFSATHFRETSVVDRPDPSFWGALYDRLIAKAQWHGNLVELAAKGDEDEAYAAANHTIVRDAQAWAERIASAGTIRTVALLVWEGKPRASSDATDQFGELAAAAGFEQNMIPTLEA
jgi:hypothetical protein